MDHIPTPSIPLKPTFAGHGFDPSSPGDSTPASLLGAQAPSVSFDPIVSVCKVLSAAPHQDLEVLPVLGNSMDPEGGMARDAFLRPPAELPPPTPQTLMPSTNFLPLIPPSGLLMEVLIHEGTSRPSPFHSLEDGGGMSTLLPDSLWGPPPFCSVNHVVTCPRVLGFHGDGWSYARSNLTGMATTESPGTLIDAGANICLTGDLDFLVDVMEIPPLPISVALQGEITTDNCCTAWGKIPLQLDNGSVYWQDCYYNKLWWKQSFPPKLLLIQVTYSDHGIRQGIEMVTLLRVAFGLTDMTAFSA